MSAQLRGASRVTYRDVLANPEFRALYVAQALSVLGDQVAQIAVAILVFDRTRSPLLATLTFAVTLLPWLIGGPLLSTLADRLPRRRVMIGCDVARAGVIAVVAIPGTPLWVLYVLIFLVILFESPFSAARSATLPDVLGEGEEYVVAASLSATTGQLGQVVGYVVGGTLVALFGTSGALLLDAATFAISAVLIARWVRPRPPAATDEPVGVIADMKTGLRVVFGTPMLRSIVLLAWVTVGCAMAAESLAVVYTARHHGGAVTAGVLTAALPLGAIVGSLTIKRYASYTSARLLPPLSLVALVPLVLTVLDPPIPVVWLLWVIAGAGNALQIVANRVFVLNVPAHVRGRAFGIAATGLMAAQGAGTVLAGWLTGVWGVHAAIAAVAAGGLLIVAVVLATWPTHVDEAAAAEPSTPGPIAPILRERDESGAMTGGTAVAWHARPTARVWMLTAGVSVVAALLLVLVVPRWHAPMQSSAHLLWIPIVALFAISEAFPLHFQFRQQARSMYLDYVAVVLGLFFLPPAMLVAVRVGVIFAIRVPNARQQRAMRLAYNLAATALWTELTLAVFHALLPVHATLHVAAWPAAIGAVIVDDLASTLGVALVLFVFEGVWRWTETLRPLGFGLPVDVVNTFLGIITASAVAFDRSTIYVILLFVLLALGAFYSYHRLSDRHAALDRLYSFTRDLGPVAGRPGDISPALRQLSALLHSRSLELALLSEDSISATVIRVLGDESGSRVDVLENEPLDDVSLSMLRDGRAFVSATDASPFARWRRRRRMRFADDRMGAAIGVGGRPLALLRADQRSGDFRKFDESDLRLLEAAADQLGAALEKGELLERLRRAATRDSLTDLANLDTLRTFLAEVLEAGRGAVVLLIDINHFHDVNDTLGHDAGDAVLVEVARRLEESATAGSLPCRVGGDQFALVIPGGSAGEVARLAALAVKSRVEGAVRFADVTADVRVTIGLARAPEHGDDAITLLRRAEIAMTSAKGTASGINEWEASFEEDSSRRLHVVSGLRTALASNELWVEYQPKIRLGSGDVAGLEALVRWRHPALGMVSPAEFIPLAEATGLISALTSNVLRMSLETVRRWHDADIMVGVSVNVSARSLDDPILVGQVAALLTASDIEPGWLTLEITESSVMMNPARSLEALRQLRSLGVRLSIDDFGTGYSSLHYIRGLPVHEVKIDKSFVDAVDTDPANRAIVRAVVELADSLHLVTVAEGVEEASQALTLEGVGVHEVQGYFYSRPMPEDRATEWLSKRPIAALEEDPENARGWDPA